ncbi:MAG: MFS transporter [Terriglobia bacterium]
MPVQTSGATARKRIFSTSGMVLFLLCVMYGFTYIDRTNVSMAAPVFGRELHFNNTEVGLVFSAFAYPYLVLQFVGGWFSDQFGARLTLTLCAVIWAGATVLTGLAGGLASMLFARVLLGFGEGATFPTATRAMSDWVPEGKWGFAQGITHSSSRLANALTPPLVAWLIMLVTWRGSFILLGIVSFAWAIVWVFYFRDNPADHPGVTAKELKSLPKRPAGVKKKKDPVPWGRLGRRLLPVTIVYFCYAWTLWMYFAWIPSFFLHSYKLNLKNSALFSALVFSAGVVGDTLGGVISDWILVKTGDRDKARRDMVVAGLLLTLACLIPIFYVRNIDIVAICLSMGGFFSELTIGPMWAIPMDIAPRYSGSASGIMNSGSALAAILSPLVFGFVIDKTHNWDLPFIGSIGLLLFGAIMAFWMKPGEPLPGAGVGDAPGVSEAGA